MNIDPFLIWIESTALSQWVVGAPTLFAFPGILVLHAVGMGLAAGLAAAFDLRILGVAKQVRFAEMRRYLPVLWFGFWLNAASGMLLLIGYPTKALTNPVFHLKIALIVAAMLLLRQQVRLLAPDAAQGVPGMRRVERGMAIVSLLCWAGAITAGRLLAYTYTRLMATP
jgi:hypothetical protein